MSEQLAKKIREHALLMTHKAKASHIGSCLSMADLLAVLYKDILRVKPSKPDWADRDRFILSKGHGAAILYAVLAERGFFKKEELKTFYQVGSRLAGMTNFNVPGVEISTGSLGHGLPIGCGMALVGKKKGKKYRIFVLLGDGELNEGSNWEAMLFAAHHKLDNLVIIVDCNGLQALGETKNIINLDSLEKKFEAFNWSAVSVDGHNHNEIKIALTNIPIENGKPSVIVAYTVKGKGISFMEKKPEWHYKSLNDKELSKALDEIK